MFSLRLILWLAFAASWLTFWINVLTSPEETPPDAGKRIPGDW